MYYRQCLLATCLLAAAITVRTGAFSFAPQANPPASGSKPPASQASTHPEAFGTAARWIRWHRQVPRVSHRSRRHAQGDAPRSGEEPTIPRGDPGLRELSRARPGARRGRRQRAHSKVQGDEACRSEPDMPDVPQPRRPRRRGKAARTSDGICPARPAIASTVRSRSSTSSSRRPRPKLCATCHRLQVAKTERAVAHMPVREGKLSCSSCHNPHGSISNVKNLKTGSSVSELCISCHTEMRGPMLWEHAPVRENCTTCHDPHGSSNDRMLVVRMPMLCQRCHVATRHPATLYDKDEITATRATACSAARA